MFLLINRLTLDAKDWMIDDDMFLLSPDNNSKASHHVITPLNELATTLMFLKQEKIIIHRNNFCYLCVYYDSIRPVIDIFFRVITMFTRVPRQLLATYRFFITLSLLTISCCISAEVASAANRYLQISAYSDTVCAVRQDQTVVCWGNQNKVKETPVNERFIQVNQSLGAVCGITTHAALKCWGSRPRSNPEAQPTGQFSWIGKGELYHNCAIRTNGQLVCWNWDNVDEYNVLHPPAGRYKQVSSGASHSCAIRADGAILCWGVNDHGQTDAPKGQFKALSSGHSHNCAIRMDGTLHCWGNNAYAQTKSPYGSFVAISSGNFHNCAITDKGRTTCWGEHTSRQLIVPRRRFVHVSSGPNYHCGIDKKASILCWGNINRLSVPEPLQTSLSVANAFGMTFPNKPSDRTVIVDQARLLTGNDTYHIDEVASVLWKVTGVSLYVVTIDKIARYHPTVQGKPTDEQLERYARELMANWNIGLKQTPYDMLFLVSRDDRKLRIQLGNGWSNADNPEIGDIIQSSIIPHFKQGHFGQGILAGVHRLNRLARNRHSSRPPVVTSASVDKQTPEKPITVNSESIQTQVSAANTKIDTPTDQTVPVTSSGWLLTTMKLLIVSGLAAITFLLLRRSGPRLLKSIANSIGSLTRDSGSDKKPTNTRRLSLLSRAPRREKKYPLGFWLLGIIYLLFALYGLGQTIVFISFYNFQLPIPKQLLAIFIPLIVFFISQPVIWFVRLRIAWYSAFVIQILFILTGAGFVYEGADLLISAPALTFLAIGILVLLSGLAVIIISFLIIRYLRTAEIKGLFFDTRV